MSEILDALHGDHANMVRLLDALERQLAVFDSGETPDYPLIADVLAYCRGYPDRFHHPKEDAIVELLLRRRPEAAEAFGSLGEEHRRIGELTQAFSEAVEQVLSDQEMPRDWFDEAARQFIVFYRRHLEWEEDEIFPAAREALTPEDWQDLDSRFRDEGDPVFGAGDAARFRQLREALVAPGGTSG